LQSTVTATYCHSLNKEAFLNPLDFAGINSFMELLSKLISITVHMAPNVEILIRTFVVLVGLDPSESMLG
jgi:hypothetical protein